MNVHLAFTAWAKLRGDKAGFLFCDLEERKHFRLVHHEAWPNKKFVSFLQSRLSSIGVPQELSKFYTGHSIKRGRVQLLRLLQVRDTSFMKWFEMTGTVLAGEQN